MNRSRVLVSALVLSALVPAFAAAEGDEYVGIAILQIGGTCNFETKLPARKL